MLSDDPSLRIQGRSPDPIGVSFPALRAWHLDNVLITNEFVVHDERHLYIDSSIVCTGPAEDGWADIVARFTAAIDRAEMTDTVIDEVVLVMHNEGGGTWGHYLVQNFPKVLLFRRAFPNGRIAVPRYYATGDSNYSRLFDLFGVPRDCLVGLDYGRTVRVREAVLIDFAWNFPLGVPHPIALELLASAPAAIPMPLDESGIFIARTGKGSRAVANQGEVYEVLARRGIALRELGATSVQHQSAIWQQGIPMVGILGSDFANIVFAPPGAQVLTLSPAWFGDRFFYNLAAARGVVWNELFCGRMGERVDPIRFSSFFVDIEKLNAVLDVMGL